jgi:glycosyltransferase involved in cell wall biosynthesis
LKISVVIPSRLQSRAVAGAERLHLACALESIAGQKSPAAPEIEVLVGIDAGAAAPPGFERPGIRFVPSDGRSQAQALNAAAAQAGGDYIAFLEDDDEWSEQFLHVALQALGDADFVASTQLEVTERGAIVRINDFPCPSGWIMKRAVWQAVGAFDPAYRWHLDNDWLGRLAERGARRIHLVEATAPVSEGALANRPALGHALRNGGPSIALRRHASPWPLVRRLMHEGSGMARIARDAPTRAASDAELARLRERYGRIPW